MTLPPRPRTNPSNEPTTAKLLDELLDEVKLRALHVQVLKLLRAQQPTSMPTAFAEALRMLRLIVEQG